MRYEFKASFDRSTKRLSDNTKIEIKKAVFEILDLISTGKTASKKDRVLRDCVKTIGKREPLLERESYLNLRMT